MTAGLPPGPQQGAPVQAPAGTPHPSDPAMLLGSGPATGRSGRLLTLGLGVLVVLTLLGCLVAYLVVRPPDLPVVPLPHRPLG